jgi:predicted nucleic acid-binding protein
VAKVQLKLADGEDAGAFEAGERSWQPGELFDAGHGRMRLRALIPRERLGEFVDSPGIEIWEVEPVSDEELIAEIARHALEQLQPQPPRYLLDSNIFDKLADDSHALELTKRLVTAGRIALLTTHVQLDELIKVKDDTRLAELLSVPAARVPTFGFVLDTSRLDMARVSGEQPLEKLRGENREKYTNDALIAATAQYEGATLVTEDSTLRNRSRGEAIAAIDWPTFRERLFALEAADADLG